MSFRTDEFMFCFPILEALYIFLAITLKVSHMYLFNFINIIMDIKVATRYRKIQQKACTAFFIPNSVLCIKTMFVDHKHGAWGIY